MAKGDDGNYLQHSVEMAAARLLAERNPRGLHMAITHGMAPFETLECRPCEPKPGLVRRRLLAALRLAGNPWQEGEPAIVTAYRCIGAEATHYPNSAELLRTIWSGDCTGHLSGGITEVCQDKHCELAAAWHGSSVRTACESWRTQIERGVLACPSGLDRPWLFTMDPMTYDVADAHDDDKLHKSDMARLAKGLGSYVGSGQPGIATLFVYNVRASDHCRFWQFAEELAEQVLAGRPESGWRRHCVTHRGGNCNLVALLYSGAQLPTDFVEDAVEEIEDAALAAAMRTSEPEFSTRAAVMEVLEGNRGDDISAQLRS